PDGWGPTARIRDTGLRLVSCAMTALTFLPWRLTYAIRTCLRPARPFRSTFSLHAPTFLLFFRTTGGGTLTTLVTGSQRSRRIPIVAVGAASAGGVTRSCGPSWRPTWASTSRTVPAAVMVSVRFLWSTITTTFCGARVTRGASAAFMSSAFEVPHPEAVAV